MHIKTMRYLLIQRHLLINNCLTEHPMVFLSGNYGDSQGWDFSWVLLGWTLVSFTCVGIMVNKKSFLLR